VRLRGGSEPAARASRERRAARGGGSRTRSRRRPAARLGGAQDRGVPPTVDPGRCARGGGRRAVPRRRARSRRARDRAAVRGAHRRPAGPGGAQGCQDPAAGAFAVPGAQPAALLGRGHRGRGARADVPRDLRCAGPRSPGRGPRLDPQTRGAGGRRAHTARTPSLRQVPLAETASPEFRCGFAALVGRPNVGKSTLLNALVGQKLSIVTPRPQTTRHRILGISHLPDAQIAFVDTPGLHAQAGRALNKAMNRTAATALQDADLVVLVLEALHWTAEDDFALGRIVSSGRPAVAAINKIDRARPRERLLPYIAEVARRHEFLAIVPVSALKLDNIEDLR